VRRTRALGVIGMAVVIVIAAMSPAAASANVTSTGWAAASPTTPQPWDSALLGVSCPATTLCMAVGTTGKPKTSGLTELWNGTAWALRPTPATTGSEASLTSVSCSGTSTCFAAGEYLPANGGTAEVPLAEMWNGSRWVTQYMPAPNQDTGTTGLRTGGISCSSSADCVTVGVYPRPSGYDAAFAEFWNGTKWTREVVPAPSGATGTDQYGLEGISCFGDGTCVAAGNYDSNPLIEYWNGSSWSVLDSAPVAGASGVGIYSLACASSSDCTAVGYQADTTEEPLALGWNGATWTDENAPDPNSGYTYLHAVSCASGACMAVGSTSSPSGAENLAERWDGTSWAVTAIPAGNQGLLGVACAASNSCEAVGSAGNGLPTNISVGMSWNGSAWAAQSTPNATGSLGVLSGVSCPSSGACVAVGQYEDRNATRRGLIETGSGTTWTRSAASTVNGSLSSVSCVSNLCMAVGDRQSGRPFSQSSTGGTWTTTTISGMATVSSVSCSGPSSCVAVGTNGTRVAAATWSGAGWSTSSLPVPANSTAAALDAVSCLTSFCVATGDFDNASSQQLPLVEIWNGTTWSISTVPSPGPSSSSNLTSVSCFSVSACEAVGSSFTSSTDVGLAYRWNGSAWTLQSTPSLNAYLNGVSCPTATSCTAVGTDESSAPLIESWNGSAWSVATVQTPFGAANSDLAAVSCISATDCSAAGMYETDSPYSGTLIESES